MTSPLTAAVAAAACAWLSAALVGTSASLAILALRWLLALLAGYLSGLALTAYRASPRPQPPTSLPAPPQTPLPPLPRLRGGAAAASAAAASQLLPPPQSPVDWLSRAAPLPGSALDLSPLDCSPSAARKRFAPLVHRFDFPVECMREAVFRKYLPPGDALNPHVVSAAWQRDEDEEGVGGGGGGSGGGGAAPSLCRRRVIFNTGGFVPYLVRRMVGAGEQLVVEEAFEWHDGARTLLARVSNASDRHLAAFLELSIFAPHPAAPACATLYTSWVEIASDNVAGRKLVDVLPDAPREVLKKHIACLQARAAAAEAEAAAAAAAGMT